MTPPRRRAAAPARCLPKPVTALVMDFDGVFTDNRVYVFQDGREAVACNRSDGLGLIRLRKLGLPMIVISTEENPVVSARCKKLGLSCRQGVDDKLMELKKWLAANRLDIRGVVYIGNDVNDLDCLNAVGCAVVPSDAWPEARAAADIVLRHPGGAGALRELCDLIAGPR